MTATQQFIEDAIAGGWDKSRYFGTEAGEGMPENASDAELEVWLLGDKSIWIDPLAWQAVGKTRGWSSFSEHHHSSGEECNGFCIEDVKQTGWKAYWHRFIDALVDGKNIEEALKKI